MTLSLCDSLCRTYILPEPRALVSASFLWKVLLVGCQESRDASCSLRFTTFFSCLLFAFNFLEFQRSLDERERTLCRCSELLSEWFGSVGRVFYERKTTEILPRVRQTDSITTRVKLLNSGFFDQAPHRDDRKGGERSFSEKK